MKEYIVKIKDAHYITHDVRCFTIEKPAGYNFVPGQATDVSINLPSLKGELRPFTFTCLPEQNYLEFMIKIYKDHDGVTHRLGNVKAGAELVLHEVFGAIQYNGPGVFFAGGAGITPFISIFRNLYKNKQLVGNKLVYSNKTPADVIMEPELQTMLAHDFVKLFTRENVAGHSGKRIDRKFLVDTIVDFKQKFYVCGPDEFVKDITAGLLDLGAAPDTVVFEK